MDSKPRPFEASLPDTSSKIDLMQLDRDMKIKDQRGVVSDDQVKCVPPGVSRDINMLLQAKTLNQTQELHCKMTGGVVKMYINITNNGNVG